MWAAQGHPAPSRLQGSSADTRVARVAGYFCLVRRQAQRYPAAGTESEEVRT
jgi:hypothetical protein